jgi:hypothetical protein
LLSLFLAQFLFFFFDFFVDDFLLLPDDFLLEAFLLLALECSVVHLVFDSFFFKLWFYVFEFKCCIVIIKPFRFFVFGVMIERVRRVFEKDGREILKESWKYLAERGALLFETSDDSLGAVDAFVSVILLEVF